MIKDSVKQFVQKAMAEARVDIDVEYCQEHGIKYKSHGTGATKVALFNTASNRAAFNFVTKNR